MQWHEAHNRILSFIYILLITILIDLAAVFASIYVNEYVLNVFLKLFLLLFNVYQLYYLFLCITLKYGFDENSIYISRIFGLRKIEIPYESIEKYTTSSGNINAVKLSGYGGKYFALGYCKFNKLGLIHMFVTSNTNIIYIKIGNAAYAISPANYKLFEQNLTDRGIESDEWTYTIPNIKKIYKDNIFLIPFFMVTLIILILTLRPLWMYSKHLLPTSMPLNFSTDFKPLLIGTNKDFVFRQMVYGAFNMAILFCMYYAAYFTSKYSRKLAYLYIYATLAIALVFLIIQQNIICTFT